MALLPLPLIFILRQRKKLLVFIALLILVFLGGIIRYQSSLPSDSANQIQFYNDRPDIELKGVVSQAPDVRDKSTHIYLSHIAIKTSDGWEKVNGQALLFVPRYPEYKYGDELQAKGKLETPQAIDDFDYRGYLANQGIYSTMLSPRIDILSSGGGFRPLAWVYALRNRLSQSMDATLPEPQAALAQGMILGIRGNITPALQDNFIRSGTTHILVISG